MRFRLGSVLLGMALTVSMAGTVLAQADDDPAVVTDTTSDAAMAAPAPADVQAVAPSLFLQVIDPAEEDVEVSLDTAQLTVRGSTVPGAVVSVQGDLADVDDLGNFTSVTLLDEGANEIEIVASDGAGNQVSTTVYVARGV